MTNNDFTMPESVLEGYPNADELRDVIGVRFRIGAPKDTGRLIFLAFFPRPPWHCEMCGDPVLYVGQEGDCLVVHHADEDRENNHLINLVPCHHRCHTRYHNRQR